jgi:hypothetical protein
VAPPTRTDPPYVPIRTTRWPVHPKTPRWLLLAGALIVAGAILVALVHKPSRSQQASDLNAFLTDMTTDVQSCAGGVSESLNALHLINHGAGGGQNTADTIQIARYGATNCSPANNELLDDLTQYQVTESLAAYHLATAVDGLVTWCFPYAQRVQNDVANELGSHTTAARQGYAAALQRDTRDLDRQRARVDHILMRAVTATGATHPLPRLPG